MIMEICFIIFLCISSWPGLVIFKLLMIFSISNWLVGVKKRE